MAMRIVLAIVGSVSFTGAQLNNANPEIAGSFKSLGVDDRAGLGEGAPTR
jgi:hypothetical protein